MKLRALFRVLAIFLAIAFLFPGRLNSGQTGKTEASAEAAITAVLTEQEMAWNPGDVDAFMKGYSDSPDLTFAGASGITRGFQPVLQHYRKSYPDQTAMGHLDFSQYLLGNDAALVLGRGHLKRDSGEMGGIFTLVFQRFPDGWKIVHDHTSLDLKKP
jgi:ketosteroid isomerase-like protein